MDNKNILKNALNAKYPEKILCKKCGHSNEYLIIEVVPGKKVKCKECCTEIYILLPGS
jgi:hypothetical protein